MQRRLTLRARLRALLGIFLLSAPGLMPLARAEVAAKPVDTQLQLSPRLNVELPAAPSVTVPANDDLPPIATIDLTAPPKDLWQRMRNGFAMPDLDSPLVAERQAYYLNRPEMLKIMIQRSRRYMFHIVGELEKRGMPAELALLPMVESAFNPLAQSPAKAMGIWQFIPSTGRNYNLTQNWWLDQRRDIIASTTAALDYLQYIYEMHGDWHLALASYNWGENAVGKAIARNKAKGLPTDYSSLTMPGETRYYVPKLQALKNIIANPELFGIKLDSIANKAYFEQVDMPATMDVATAAKLAEIPVNEFLALNPAYSRPLMPDNGNSTLVLPADKIDVFQANVQRYEKEDKPLALWRTETLKKGEKLDTLAARHGITLARLKQINGIGPRTKLRPGTNLLVPGKGATSAMVMASLPTMPQEAAPVARSNGKHRGAAKGKTRSKVSARPHGKPVKGKAVKTAKATKKPAAKPKKR
jgi:membrane-bound lytic murein transglycosylase D